MRRRSREKRGEQQRARPASGFFRSMGHACAIGMGSSRAFLVAVCVILAWAVWGPYFHYSNTWQLVINTGTSVITFLMVFLIQSTQNRDAKAMQIKLDELLRAVAQARTGMVDIEDLSDAELDALQREFQRVRERAERGGDAGDDSRDEGGGSAANTPATRGGAGGRAPSH